MELTAEEKITLETYNTTAKQWSVKHATVGFWKEEMEIFRKLLPNGKILEIGSGGGRDAKELIALGYEYVGTDISTGLIEVAKKENLTATLLVQSVYDLDFLEGTQFDGFWASAVLLHIPKARIDTVLQRIRRFMRAGAVGFISLKQGEGERLEEDKRFFVYYSEEEFRQVLQRNNFEVVETTTRPMSEKTTWLCFFVRVYK
jgi:SAM-dependent methyltransferase